MDCERCFYYAVPGDAPEGTDAVCMYYPYREGDSTIPPCGKFEVEENEE